MMAVGAGQKNGMTRRAQPEAVFQASLIKALAMILPRDSMMFAVPNGGKRSKTEAAVMVGQGVVPGIPDLMVLWDGRGFGLECKSADGRLTPAQRDVHARFARAGVPVAVVRTLPEAITFLRECGVPINVKGIV